jgi:hypothetical protein
MEEERVEWYLGRKSWKDLVVRGEGREQAL